MLTVRGCLPADEGALLLKALEIARDELFASYVADAAAEADVPSDFSGAPLPRRTGPTACSALARRSSPVGSWQPREGDRHQVVVHVDATPREPSPPATPAPAQRSLDAISTRRRVVPRNRPSPGRGHRWCRRSRSTVRPSPASPSPQEDSPPTRRLRRVHHAPLSRPTGSRCRSAARRAPYRPRFAVRSPLATTAAHSRVASRSGSSMPTTSSPGPTAERRVPRQPRFCSADATIASSTREA